MTLGMQFWTMFMMMCGGIIMGAIYDFFRLLHEQLKLPRWTIIPLDIIYWIVATILIFQLLYNSNQGQLRMFVYVGMVVGVLLYYFLFSKTTTQVLLFIFKMIKEIYRVIVRIIHILIVKPAIILYKAFLLILRFLQLFAIFLYKIMLQLLYPLWKIILWVKRRIIRG